MSTQQSGLVSGNKQNIAGGNTPHSRSTFPLSYSRFQTERFAEYVPFFVMEGIKHDRLPLHSNHEVQTYTLKSPIIQSIAKKKDYFVVPMQSILPNNWEKFYSQPNIGQDVPTDSGLGVQDFWLKMKTLFDNSLTALRAKLADTSLTNSQKLDAVFHFLIFFEPIYSAGSLMTTLGISGHNWFRAIDQTVVSAEVPVGFDEIFDKIIGLIETRIATSVGNSLAFTLGGNSYEIVSNANNFVNISVQQVLMREALELMRDDLSFIIGNFSGTIGTLITDITTYINDIYFVLPSSDAPLNLGRLWSYQLVVSHFYSNDHVDFIYSAELFRSYILQLVTRIINAGVNYAHKFTVNGLEYFYDSLSAHYFNSLISSFGTSGIFSFSTSQTSPDSANEAFAYFVALFSFKRSLRFMDYFTGSRAYPLAGNQNPAANVSGGQVAVLEMSRASMMTKFLQAVNRSGRKFSNYMKELFGGKDLDYDYHNPMYLSHASDLVGAQETENTGAAQVATNRSIAVTSRLRASSSAKAFVFVPDRDCIVLGISYYDLPRVYTRSTERQNFVLDRFDMFNPFLQYIGDQGISEAEIGTDTPNVAQNFSYCNKDMHYKQRFNQAAGGFCVPSTQLDTWLFPADVARRRFFHNISPSFIRSFNSELDRFYQSLTGYSLGTYFHFIVRYDNRMDAGREMTYAPTIEV